MNIVFILLPLTLLLALIGLAAYIWNVKSGQLDDLETPAVRMLFEDEEEHIDRTKDDEINLSS